MGSKPRDDFFDLSSRLFENWTRRQLHAHRIKTARYLQDTALKTGRSIDIKQF